MYSKSIHINLATYFQSKPLYLDGEEYKKPNVRKLVEQPWQEINGFLEAGIYKTLTNPSFLILKNIYLGIFEIINDFKLLFKVDLFYYNQFELLKTVFHVLDHNLAFLSANSKLLLQLHLKI